jgi:hypothetical protein
MDKDIGLMLGILPTSILSAILFTHPITVTIATVITLFYGAQIFGSLTIYLHQEVSTSFYPFTICYVCSAVGGTWMTGTLLHLAGIPIIPKIFIFYLAGQSALAIAQQSQYIYETATEHSQKQFSIFLLFLIGVIEINLGAYLTSINPFHILLAYLGGVATLKIADNFNHYMKYRSEVYGTPYYDVEENLAIFFLTLISLIIMTLTVL